MAESEMTSQRYDEIFTMADAGDPNYREVAMDRAEILILPENQAGAIATRRLGGCSVVVILGRTAAIMAHIAPRPPGRTDSTHSLSEAHFLSIVQQIETLYIYSLHHFPPESTVWGVFVTEAEEVTGGLMAILTLRFQNLGLRNQHTFYNPRRIRHHRDEFRVGIEIEGSGTTAFFIETERVERVFFPTPLPDPNASQSLSPFEQSNFLIYSATVGILQQQYFGSIITPDQTRMTGVYDVLVIDYTGTQSWRQYNSLTGMFI